VLNRLRNATLFAHQHSITGYDSLGKVTNLQSAFGPDFQILEFIELEFVLFHDLDSCLTTALYSLIYWLTRELCNSN
jgi:hypothetical protein